MTEHYVTLFDSVFLPQGLALHHSLLEHGGACVLWVLCLDDACLNTLQRLDLPKMRLLNLAKLETPDLLTVKPSRSRAEYCWTLTPWSIQWVFEADPHAQRVTYVDADVFFLQSPALIFTEFEDSERGVLLTRHGYAPEYDQTPTSGKFCVQFISFVRNQGAAPLNWWASRCLEWCYERAEEGKFGDQKYLETMNHIYGDLVHIASASKWFQAPWNASIYPFSEAIVYHFHQLRLCDNGTHLFPPAYKVPDPTLQYVYLPYCRILAELAVSALGQIPKQREPLALPNEPSKILRILKNMKKFLSQIMDQTPQHSIPRHFLTRPSCDADRHQTSPYPAQHDIKNSNYSAN